MVQQHRQNMYASHFTNCLLGFLAYMNIIFCWAEQGLKPTLAGLVVANSYHSPHPSIANSYLQDAKLPDLCIPLPLELFFLCSEISSVVHRITFVLPSTAPIRYIALQVNYP